MLISKGMRLCSKIYASFASGSTWVKRIILNYGGNTFMKYTGPVIVWSTWHVQKMRMSDLISPTKIHKLVLSKVSLEESGDQKQTTMKKLTKKFRTGENMELPSTHPLWLIRRLTEAKLNPWACIMLYALDSLTHLSNALRLSTRKN